MHEVKLLEYLFLVLFGRSLYRSCVCFPVPFKFYFQLYSKNPLIRTLVIRITNYPDRLGVSGKSVAKSMKISCLEITGSRIKYSTVYSVQCTVYSVQCTVYSVQRTVQNFKSSVVERVRRRYILLGITTELQTANVAYFQRKVELSGFSAYPNDSPSQLIWISGVLLCSYSVVFRNNNQTSNCQCSLFSKKVELSGFSAYPNGSPFQLIWISGVLLCSYSIVYFAFT